MKILNLSKVNAYYVSHNRSYGYQGFGSTSIAVPTNISDMTFIQQITSFDDVSPYTITQSSGIAFGTNKDVQDLIKSRKNKNDISTFKKVYFDQFCKYPRFKLASSTSIKRCLNPSKADTCILTVPHYQEYEKGRSRWASYPIKPSDVIVLYSNSNQAYYIFDQQDQYDFRYDQYRNKQQVKLSSYFDQLCSASGSSKTERFINTLMQQEIIPKDCRVDYCGNILLLNYNELIQIGNIINNYMLITYDTELDKFVNKSLQVITKEELSSINKMLQSSDESVVGMGLKLLSSYDVTATACGIGLLIIDNWPKISRLSVINSVGFQQVLSSLGLTKNDISYKSSKLINQLYEKSTSESDRELGKQVLQERLQKDIEVILERYKTEFPNIALTCNYEIK